MNRMNRTWKCSNGAWTNGRKKANYLRWSSNTPTNRQLNKDDDYACLMNKHTQVLFPDTLDIQQKIHWIFRRILSFDLWSIGTDDVGTNHTFVTFACHLSNSFQTSSANELVQKKLLQNNDNEMPSFPIYREIIPFIKKKKTKKSNQLRQWMLDNWIHQIVLSS